MKTAAWIVVALLAGLVLGGWGLKADLRKARKDISRLQDEVNRKARKQGRLDGIATMLNIPQGRDTEAVQPAGGRDGRLAGGTGARAGASPHSHDFERRHGSPGSTRHEPGAGATNRSMRQDIETAVNLWKVRSQLARDNFVSETTTNDGQAARFDVLMAAMNVRLSNSIRTWVDCIKTNETLTPENGVKMMNELSGVLVQTYTDIDRDFPDWREKTEGGFNAMDLVDPQVALPLAEVEDIIKTQQWDHAESFTNAPEEE